MPVNTRLAALAASALACVLLCAACSRPAAPDTDQPPEPQAATPTESNTELRDAIQRPIDKARAVEQVQLDAAQRQRAQIEAQTGG